MDIPVPEPVYSIGVSSNREFDTQKVRYNYQSFITPSSVYDYDVKTGKSELLKQQPVLGGYDPTPTSRSASTPWRRTGQRCPSRSSTRRT